MITLIRHGRPKNSGIILGQLDVSLEPHILGKNITGFSNQIDLNNPLVICSPLLRSMQTATLLGFENYIVDDRIAEMNLGLYEGLEANLSNLTQINSLQKNPDIKLHGGESYNEFFGRVKSFFDEYKDDPRDIIVITHSGVIRVLCSQILGIMKTGRLPDYLEIIKLSPMFDSFTHVQANLLIS